MSKRVFFSSLVVLIATICSVVAIESRREPVVIATNLERLPEKIDGFIASEQVLPEAVYEELVCRFKT